ncbi:DUF4124 domain-containing protein [Thermomonas sp. HDW16]|uniref:DUF4124 domain-containing protein n=1 Tax=Thermomonas sp. HDW16 TaxID=2714945 RepID=UPI00140E5368|nr:DUF4124 domain-containing protein [Thermomonas sp. HDW16]QIL21493.1 DUF4124 domain-containing protein [Thermomonas sp. HDW16]
MLALALALSAAAWWWFTSEMPRRERERVIAAEAAMKQAERANSLYRWRDADGNLQITEAPPQGRKFERISRTPSDGIQVDGTRE